MANPLLQHYVKLTEFLGLALGPDYEVALHDLTDRNRSLIAIANNHISGREIGAPLTNVALRAIMDRSYETEDYRLHYYGTSADRELSERVLQLCHPDVFVSSQLTPPPAPAPDNAESFHNSIDAVAADAITQELQRLGVTADRLTPDERLCIISSLAEDGIFLLKGAVKDVAAALHCSQASVYRYLSQVRGKKPQDAETDA